jgi:2-polyprenyl-6-methoxyphenol hydroxylase-like FAD-dependent oxidoreductase
LSGIACVFAQILLAGFVAKVGFLFRLVLHPGNYYFIAFASCAVGDLLQCLAALGIGSLPGYGIGTNLGHLGACISVLGSIFLPLHAQMVCEVASITSFEGFEYDEDPGWSIGAAVPEDASPADWEAEDLKEIEVEVLICGGGPVGLANANELGLLNVRTLLLEERQNEIPDPRFFVCNCQTMEAMSRLGVVEHMKELGCPQDIPFGAALTNGMAHPGACMQSSACVPGREWCEKNSENLSDVTCSRFIGSRYTMIQPQRIMQARQERVLRKAGEARESVTILYGHRLVKFREVHTSEENGIQALVQPLGDDGNPVGQCLLVRAQYLIGCDGPGGPVARTLGFKYDGFANLTETQSCMVQSPELTKHVREHVGLANQYQIARAGIGIGLFVHVDPVNGLWNFVGRWLFDPKRFKNNEEAVREFVGPVDFKIVLEGHWYWNFFIARSFLRGRVILAGDSAHSWPPVCGLGGNTGYADSANLGWKLAAVVKGWGGKGLLQSYSIERRTAALYAAQNVMVCTPRPYIMLLLCRVWTSLEKVCPPLLRILRWKWKYGNSGHHTGNHHCQSGVQLGTRYDLSPICITEKVIPADDPFVTYKPRISAGARLPFCPLSDGTPLFEALSIEGYTLLVLAGGFPSDTSRTPSSALESIKHQASKISVVSAGANEEFKDEGACQASVNSLENAFALLGAPLKVLGLSGSQLSITTQHLRGAHRECARLYRKEALVLVRPDRIVAWHMPKQNVQTVLEQEAVEIAQVCCGHIGKNEESAALCSLRWLTSRFLFSLRPYGFAFPNALPLQNQTKEEAIALLRAKKDAQYDASKTKMKEVGKTDQEKNLNEPNASTEPIIDAVTNDSFVACDFETSI